MKKFLIFLLLVLFVCNTVVFAQKSNEKIKYIALMTNDFENGERLNLQMETKKLFSSLGYSIEFRHENYGYFHTFGLYIQSPSTPIVFLAESPARGNLTLEKNDSYHFIFFLEK